MKNEIIKLIRQALFERKPYFTREQEIQIYLAEFIKTKSDFDDVFLEYHIPSAIINNYPWTDSKKVYIDIVLVKDDLYYPIEIKFKTVSQLVPLNLFGSKYSITLGQHGAQNIGCYDFWKDIKRLELFEEKFENVSEGIMLFITNDLSYLKPPRNKKIGYV